MTSTPVPPPASPSPSARRIAIVFLAVGLVLGAALILVGIVLVSMNRPAPPPLEIIPATATLVPTATATPGPLRVYISGAVIRPDVYLLPPGSIAKDAVAAAGGASSDANLNSFNLAAHLTDGEQLYLPHKSEALTATPAGSPAAGRGVKVTPTRTQTLVNLNTATADELDTLPGVGPSMAQRIIEARPFKTVADLRKVRGVGNTTFARLSPLVTVGGPQP